MCDLYFITSSMHKVSMQTGFNVVVQMYFCELGYLLCLCHNYTVVLLVPMADLFLTINIEKKMFVVGV